MSTRIGARLSDKARAFLEEKRFLVLATINEDGTPQQSTVWYELQDDEIMMNTRRGRLKDRNLRRHPRCSICVEDGYVYVEIRGRVTLIDDQQIAQSDIKHLSLINHGQETAEQQARDQFTREPRVTIRLNIDHVVEYGL